MIKTFTNAFDLVSWINEYIFTKELKVKLTYEGVEHFTYHKSYTISISAGDLI